MKYLLNAIGIVLVLIITGCGTSLRVIKVNPETKLFPTMIKVDQDDIIVREMIDLNKYTSLLLVRVNTKYSLYQDFFQQSVKNLTIFDTVFNKVQFEQALIEKGLTGEVVNISDLIGLHRASKYYGKFLIADLQTNIIGRHYYLGETKVLNPENGKIIFHVKKKAFNWDGLDQPLYYPMFNELAMWVRENTSKLSKKN